MRSSGTVVGQAERVEEVTGPVDGRLVDPFEGLGEGDREHQADRDRVAVRDRVAAGGLDGVRQGVAVVERGPGPGALLGVAGDDRGFDRRAPGDEVGEGLGVAGQHRVGAAREQRGDAGPVGEQRVLRDLAQPGPVLVGGEGAERCRCRR